MYDIRKRHDLNHHLATLECLEEIGQEAGEKGTSERSAFRQILSIKVVHMLAFFILVHVGVEVTIGGLSKASRVLRFYVDRELRLDRYLYHPGSRWWAVCRIHLFWILRWSVLLFNRLTLSLRWVLSTNSSIYRSNGWTRWSIMGQ